MKKLKQQKQKNENKNDEYVYAKDCASLVCNIYININ